MLSKNVLRSLSVKPWNSPLQLVVGGLMIYMMAVIGGPYFGCGPGNSVPGAGAFSCQIGTMGWQNKTLIVLIIALAASCWGRAASLHQKQQTEDSR